MARNGIPEGRAARGTKPLLRDARPDLIAEWHPRKNPGLSPERLTIGSNKRVWWRCPMGPDHEWQTSVANRALPSRGGAGTSCPFCAGKRASITNSLATLRPDLAKEWDVAANGDLTPTDVLPGSNKKVHWRCNKSHQWIEMVTKRANRGFGCPYCSRKRVTTESSLAATHPAIAAEWAADLNSGLTPENILNGSSRRYWWRCTAGHVWQTSPAMRTTRGGTGCPYCENSMGRASRATLETSLAMKNPEIAAQWDSHGNGSLLPSDVRPGSEKIVAWACPAAPDHRWRAKISHRVKAPECPFCAGRRASSTSSLAARYPEVAEEWHPTRNGDVSADDVTGRSQAKVWWLCSANPHHEWKSAIRNRTVLGNGCPYCSGFYASADHSIAAKFPEIARLWHPTKNGDLTPDEVPPAAKRSVWWKCPRGEDHEWQREVHQATRGVGCPFCSNRRVCSTNNLAAAFPHIAAEWHPSKNGSRTPDRVVFGSTYRAWWRCSADPLHEWTTTVVARTHNGTNCPYCNLAPRSLQELLLAYEIREFIEFDPDFHKVTAPDGGQIRILDVDIVIAKHRLIVEFDGAYWHKGKEDQDRAKGELLRANGWTVIRVRESPLQALHVHDAEVAQLAPKSAANSVLRKIEEIFHLGLDLSDYLESRELRAELKARRHALALNRQKQAKTRA